MKDNFGTELNELLVDTFNSIRKIEESSLRARHDNKLSISEYHLLESVGKGSQDGRTVSEIALDLGITTASVTVSVNKLVKKGFVEKTRCTDDGRVVFVRLTREGRRINAGHRLFHQHLIRSLSKEFDDEELKILVRCIEKINSYFKR
jgi:DNA-binding MarR family transcriptional regulator